MPKLLDKTNRTVTDSRSAIGFATTGGGAWEVWDRYLTVDGKHAYHVGNVCGTCAFFFERMEGANKGIEVGALASTLAEGIADLDGSLVDTLAQLIPNSAYVVALIRVTPQRVQLLGANDYFSGEQVANVGIDGFWGQPHYAKVAYYRVEDRSAVAVRRDAPNAAAFDFIVPMFPESWLNEDRVQYYERALAAGCCPTAVAISILDVKSPASILDENDPVDGGKEHWCLAHYLVDGHHKIAAAARSGQEITLLSFIALDHGVSSPEQVEAMLQTYERAAS